MANHEAASEIRLLDHLHAATRVEHANLNHTIIARLPLCLPQATSTSNLYCQGMTAISQIYYGFEEAWDSLLSEENLTQQQRYILDHINISQLRRTEKLDRDLKRLRRMAGRSWEAHFSELDAAVSHFKDDVRRAVLARPHLILAYTWTMYLALFNGGRWIAKQLLSAGNLFWDHEDRKGVTSDTLSFWFFGEDEHYDGTDLKIAFKHKFNKVTDVLSEQEREEVVAESRNIFNVCVEMVAFLDRFTASEHDSTLNPLGSPPPPPHSFPTIKRSSVDVSKPGYLTSLAPTSVTNLWHFIVDTMPFPRIALSAPLMHDLEPKQG